MDMNNYKKKANKYKYKYLKLKELYAGVGFGEDAITGRKWRVPEPNPKPEPDKYLYHGTSSYYIDSIKENGLLTKYPEELFNPIKKCWDIMHKDKIFIFHYKKERGYNYIEQFIRRNNPDDETQTSSQISLTDDIETAKQYAVGGRIIGEGPTFFNEMLNKYLNKLDIKDFKSFNELETYDNANALLIEMKELKTKLNDATNVLIYPRLILAVDINNIINKRYIQSSIEYVTYNKIEPGNLFIYKEGDNSYTSLLSKQGSDYVNDIKKLIELYKKINTKKREKQILKEKLEKLQREEEEKLEKLQREEEEKKALDLKIQISKEKLKREEEEKITLEHDLELYIKYINTEVNSNIINKFNTL